MRLRNRNLVVAFCQRRRNVCPSFFKVRYQYRRPLGQARNLCCRRHTCNRLGGAWALLRLFETWQLVINTSTTIITFLMVFVLQNSQNRDGKALQAKLDELILTSQAQNKFVGIEKLDEQELRRKSKTLAEKAESKQAPA